MIKIPFCPALSVLPVVQLGANTKSKGGKKFLLLISEPSIYTIANVRPQAGSTCSLDDLGFGAIDNAPRPNAPDPMRCRMTNRTEAKVKQIKGYLPPHNCKHGACVIHQTNHHANHLTHGIKPITI